MESCAAFGISYTDRGLFGVYGVSHPDKAGEMVTFITKAMAGLTEISEEERKRAKAIHYQ